MISFKDDASTVGAPKIIFSRISPPIHIDSRIAARDKKLGSQQVASKSSKPAEENSIMFEPDALMKEYVKKGKAKGQKASEVKIENNLKGLFDYLTAPNIRNKVKSILFFLIRFSSCFKAYMPLSEIENANVYTSLKIREKTSSKSYYPP